MSDIVLEEEKNVLLGPHCREHTKCLGEPAEGDRERLYGKKIQPTPWREGSGTCPWQKSSSESDPAPDFELDRLVTASLTMAQRGGGDRGLTDRGITTVHLTNGQLEGSSQAKAKGQEALRPKR